MIPVAISEVRTSVDEMYQKMKAKLSGIVPDVELWYKAELACEVNRLKDEKNAVILGHNYMEPALYHSIPDFTGDSLELSRKAAQTDKDAPQHGDEHGRSAGPAGSTAKAHGPGPGPPPDPYARVVRRGWP